MQDIDWPEDVLYRFLTIVGATVDITYLPDDSYRAHCTGCDSEVNPEHATDYDLNQRVKPWAQKHSETCRALRLPHHS
ncbi:hypothetical protein G6045_14005 [Streptomyces sp. YC504]|uniref:Uncharacterized protein n=1 Tax=Streptomyces mesophilus TaxID=1775132 RepID=A0A6G4XJG5_9ACTN|nr:hypothetical protein [Streptomyces mesophilus]NGO76771.1 hypothetical protein [Streptomyces mesophilus]